MKKSRLSDIEKRRVQKALHALVREVAAIYGYPADSDAAIELVLVLVAGHHNGATKRSAIELLQKNPPPLHGDNT